MKVIVARESITVQLDRNQLIRRLAGITENDALESDKHLELTASARLRRSGIESKLVYPAGNQR